MTTGALGIALHNYRRHPGLEPGSGRAVAFPTTYEEPARPAPGQARGAECKWGGQQQNGEGAGAASPLTPTASRALNTLN